MKDQSIKEDLEWALQEFERIKQDRDDSTRFWKIVAFIAIWALLTLGVTIAFLSVIKYCGGV